RGRRDCSTRSSGAAFGWTRDRPRGAREGPRPRQGNGGGLQGVVGLRRGVVKVPLADAIAAAALHEVHMDVVLMISIRAGTEHRREARAGGGFHCEAEIPGNG